MARSADRLHDGDGLGVAVIREPGAVIWHSADPGNLGSDRGVELILPDGRSLFAGEVPGETCPGWTLAIGFGEDRVIIARDVDELGARALMDVITSTVRRAAA